MINQRFFRGSVRKRLCSHLVEGEALPAPTPLLPPKPFAPGQSCRPVGATNAATTPVAYSWLHDALFVAVSGQGIHFSLVNNIWFAGLVTLSFGNHVRVLLW